MANTARPVDRVGVPPQPGRRAAPRRGRTGEGIAPYLLIAPFVVSFLALFAGPALYSLVLSFYRYRGYGTATFTGLDNYRSLLGYHQFWTSWINTGIYWLGGTIVTLGVALLLAVLVYSSAIRGKTLYRPAIFLPNVMAAVAASLIFQIIFAPESGVLTALLGVKLAWNQDLFLGRVAVITLRAWHSIGWSFVIFLAGLTTINPELYDAAKVDGARAWHSLRHITLPLLRPTFLFALVTVSISSLRMFAEPNLLFSNSVAPPQFQPIMNQLYLNLQSGQFGNAAAAAWLIFIPILVVSLIQFRLLRGEAGGGEH